MQIYFHGAAHQALCSFCPGWPLKSICQCDRITWSQKDPLVSAFCHSLLLCIFPAPRRTYGPPSAPSSPHLIAFCLFLISLHPPPLFLNKSMHGWMDGWGKYGRMGEGGGGGRRVIKSLKGRSTPHLPHAPLVSYPGSTFNWPYQSII